MRPDEESPLIVGWAPRVRRDQIKRMYENDAKGITDEALIDEVGYGLYARCETIRIVTERRCPECNQKLVGEKQGQGMVRCPGCGFTSSWRRYQKSYKGKRIHGGRAYPLFLRFMSEFRRARTYREKLIAIDCVIHAVHEDASQVGTSPAGRNLIEGKLADVVKLLDGLAYGDTSTPGMTARNADWRRKIAESDMQ